MSTENICKTTFNSYNYAKLSYNTVNPLSLKMTEVGDSNGIVTIVLPKTFLHSHSHQL